MRCLQTSMWRHLTQAFLACLFICSATAAYAADTYDGTYLHIPLVVADGTTYFNVIVTVGNVVGLAGGTPAGRHDIFSGATGLLTIPSVSVGTTTYTNVQVTVGGVVAVGGSSTVTPVITAIDNTSPTPMTVLHIASSGLIPNLPAFVTFSDDAQYSVTMPAVRVASNGTVVVGTPFYTNGTSGAIGPGTVSLVVSQGNNISSPATLSIQDIPALSSYGTQTGAITKSFLTFAANLHAVRINEFLAVQPLLNGSTDTSNALSTLVTMLNAAITSRNAVDSIIQDGAYVESMTSLPSGTRLQMDQSQLMLMDRIIGAFLIQQFSAGVSSGSLAMKSPSARTYAAARPFARAPSASSVVNTLNTLLASMNGSLSARSWALGQTNSTDFGLAAADATASLSGLGENQWVGGFLSLAHINAALESMFHAISAGAVCMAASNCTDVTPIQDELNSGTKDLVSNFVQAIASTSSATRFAGALVNLTDQTATAYNNMQSLYNNGSFKAAGTTDNSLAAGSYLLGFASGTITQQTSPGTAASLPYLNFCCFGSSNQAVASFADSNGGYTALLPTNVAGTNYSAITMDVVDANSGSTMTTQTVNLSGLNARTPISIPTVNYCSNGETNYPTCKPTCANGATDYPTCTPPPPKNCLAEYNTCVAGPACNPPSNLITQNQCINACLATWLACL